MKRLIVFFIFVLVLFVSCSASGKEVVNLKIFADGVNFQLVPNYNERTIKIIYSDAQEFQSEGLVGGEYFDRFEQLIDLARDKDLKVLNTAGNEKFYLDVNYMKGKENFVLFEGQKLEFAKDFYDDLYELMTIEEPV